jgi:hypothetical protein
MYKDIQTTDSIKIGNNIFKIVSLVETEKETYKHVHITNGKEYCWLTQTQLRMLSAEIIKKTPPKYTPVKRTENNSNEYYGVSCGTVDINGKLAVRVGIRVEYWADWEVLEVKDV